MFEAMVNNLTEWTEVRVRWMDAHAPHSGWHEIDEYVPDDAVAVTIGRIWKDCKPNYLTLVGTVFEGDDLKTVSDINHIPWGMVLDIEIIREPHAK